MTKIFALNYKSKCRIHAKEGYFNIAIHLIFKPIQE